MPLDYMLAVMRDATADQKRRDAMATAAAPYLHSKLTTVEAKPLPEPNEPKGVSMLKVVFVNPKQQPDE
jgi:hypothetical protein